MMITKNDPPATHMRYIVFSCAYNEEDYIRYTLDSVCRQTIKPVQWVIVDDGSTDSTPEILHEYAGKYPFITVIRKDDNSSVPFGTEIAVNFQTAWPHFTVRKWDFFVKLDCDIDIDRNDHFEYQMRKMIFNPTLGICSGITYYMHPKNGKTVVLRSMSHTTGAMKLYRRECFKDIGSTIYPLLNWDGVDELKARFNGWHTRTFTECEVNHFGKLRSLNRQKSTNYYHEWGRSQYMRCSPVEFFLSKTLLSLPKLGPKKVIAVLRGYFSQFGTTTPRFLDPDERLFARLYLIARLFGYHRTLIDRQRRNKDTIKS